MSLATASSPGQHVDSRAALDTWIGWALIVILAGMAIWLRFLMPINHDTSWLITVSERVLDGQKLYVDIIETNPPATIWLYAPFVGLARVLHVAPETTVIVWLFVLLAICFSLTAIVLKGADWLARYDRLFLFAIALAMFAVLPGDVFSQREHFAAMLSLPFLAATLARSRGQDLSLPLLAVAGLCGALVVMIKPHFVVALELPVLVAWVVQRRWRTVFSTENIIAGGLTLAYVASTFVFYPQFWTLVMPVNRVVYLPVADQWRVLTSVPVGVFGAAVLASWLFCGRRFLHHPSAVLLAGAMGFCIAFIVQGKFFYYHLYPMMALGFIGAALAAFDRALLATGGRHDEILPSFGRQQLFRNLINPGLAGMALLAVCAPLVFSHFDREKLAEAITRLQPRPVLGILPGDLSIGHPVVRMVQGRWGMTQSSLWVSANALRLHDYYNFYPPRSPAILTEIDAVEKADLGLFLADLRRNRPEILLTVREAKVPLAHFRKFPGLAEELDRYELADTVVLQGRVTDGIETIDILRRQPDLRPAINP